uniref:Uncharacterized protein n=1 Tax=Desulfobacca acetoxidans TaxID=60893 RepID=A0A7C3SIK7_9BACT
MGVRVRQKEKGEGKPWWIFIAYKGQRKSLLVGDKRAAEAVASQIRQSIKAGEFQFEKLEKEKENIIITEELKKMLSEVRLGNKKKIMKIVDAVYNLSEGVSQKMIAEKTGICRADISIYVRRAIDEGLLENCSSSNQPCPYMLRVTEKGLKFLLDPANQPEESAPNKPEKQEDVDSVAVACTSFGTETITDKDHSLEEVLNEIILRQTRTIERLLDEYERYKQENERLTQREKQLMADNDKWLEDNLKLEEVIKALEEKIESYKEEVKKLRDIRTSLTPINLPQRVTHAMAVFGD